MPRLNPIKASAFVNSSLRLNFSKSVPMLGTISTELNINTVGELNSLAATYTCWLGWVPLRSLGTEMCTDVAAITSIGVELPPAILALRSAFDRPRVAPPLLNLPMSVG